MVQRGAARAPTTDQLPAIAWQFITLN